MRAFEGFLAVCVIAGELDRAKPVHRSFVHRERTGIERLSPVTSAIPRCRQVELVARRSPSQPRSAG